MSGRAATTRSSPIITSRSTPEFLRAMLAHLRSLDIDIVTMDEVHRRLIERDFARRFACFTFDDGYRDNRDYRAAGDARIRRAAHRLCRQRFRRRHRAAVVDRAGTGDRQGAVDRGADRRRGDAGSIPRRQQAKQAAFDRLHDWLRGLPGEHDVQREISALCARHGVDEAAICARTLHVLGRTEGRSPTIRWSRSARTPSRHCNLATADRGSGGARDRRPAARGSKPRCSGRSLHLAYPYGDRIAAGHREFALARAAGFKTAVTTRPGMIFPGERRSPDRAAAGLAQRQLSGRAHPPRADLRRRHRDVERLSPHRRGVVRVARVKRSVTRGPSDTAGIPRIALRSIRAMAPFP